MEIFQPVNGGGIIELEYQHFAAPNGIMDLVNDQHLLTSQKERQPGIVYPLGRYVHHNL